LEDEIAKCPSVITGTVKGRIAKRQGDPVPEGGADPAVGRGVGSGEASAREKKSSQPVLKRREGVADLNSLP